MQSPFSESSAPFPADSADGESLLVDPLGRGESSAGTDLDTGEPVSLLSDGTRISVRRHMLLNPDQDPSVALIDACAFSLIPPAECSHQWVIEQMRQFLPVEDIKGRNGCFGFKHSARFGDGAGLIAWGGESQRGRVYFSIQGKGCSLVSDWAGLAAWLEHYGATLKRVDVAHDDLEGRCITIQWAVDQLKAGGFNAGGRSPSHSVFGDWLHGDASIKGRTLYIGNRQSGKYCRVYEKGKQQGDPVSPWVRIEVEWRGQDRVIPLDVLVNPGLYLAGAYPCLEFLHGTQSRIRTVAKGAQIAYERAVENGRQLSGRLVNLMLAVHGGDAAAVVEDLRRDGFPARITPYSYQLAENPELVAPSPAGERPD